MKILHTVKGLACLLLFYGIGETLSQKAGLPFPGAVIGMLLLFGVLRLSGRPTPQWLNDSSQLLIRLLSLFFLPAAVGLFFLPPEFLQQWPALVSTIVFATLCSLALTAILVNRWIQKADSNSSTAQRS